MEKRKVITLITLLLITGIAIQLLNYLYLVTSSTVDGCGFTNKEAAVFSQPIPVTPINTSEGVEVFVTNAFANTSFSGMQYVSETGQKVILISSTSSDKERTLRHELCHAHQQQTECHKENLTTVITRWLQEAQCYGIDGTLWRPA